MSEPSCSAVTEINPLSIEEVLTHVLSYLPNLDLQVCKRVCRIWNDISDSLLKDRSPIEICSLPTAQAVYTLLKKRPTWGISSLTFSHFANLDFEVVELIFRRISGTLTTLKLVEGFVEQKNYFTLMRIVAPNLRALELQQMHDDDYCFFPYFPIPRIEQEDSSEYEDITDDEADSDEGEIVEENDAEVEIVEFLIFPKLTSLEYFNNQNGLSDGSSKLSNVCKACPNLEILKINCLRNYNSQEYEGLRMPNLKFLELTMIPNDRKKGTTAMGVSTAIIKCLSKLQLQLCDLRIINVSRNLDANCFKEFLESQKDTLKTLFLVQEKFISTKDNTLPTPFPLDLLNLTRLKISKPFVRNVQHVFQSAPNLISCLFDFKSTNNCKSIMPRGSMNVPPSLNTICFDYIDQSTLKDKVGQYANQLTRLCLENCGDALISIICEKFENIAEMTLVEGVLDGGMTDESLSGISKERLQGFQKLWKSTPKKCFPLTVQLMEKIESCRTKPCLGNLKNLTQATIVFKNPKEHFFLYGFWRMEKLHAIHLLGIRIPEEFREFMREGGRFFSASLGPGGSSFFRDNSLVLAGSNSRFYTNENPNLLSFEPWKFSDDKQSGKVSELCAQLEKCFV